MTSKCWVIISDDVTPLGIEHDYWVHEDALKAFDEWCRLYPYAEFEFFECIDKDEKTEKWKLLARREGAWPDDAKDEPHRLKPPDFT